MCIFYSIFCQNIPVNVKHRAFKSPHHHSCHVLRSKSDLFIYRIHIELVSREPSIVWATQVQMYPTWSVGEFERVWTSIWKLSGKTDEGEKETARRKVFLRVEAEMVRCADSSPLLCEVFWGCLLPRYLSPLAEWEGSRESAPDERGISLTKSVSTTKHRLYQIPLIPTQRCHTNHSPALSCYVKKKKKWPHLSKANIIFFPKQA